MVLFKFFLNSYGICVYMDQWEVEIDTAFFFECGLGEYDTLSQRCKSLYLLLNRQYLTHF